MSRKEFEEALEKINDPEVTTFRMPSRGELGSRLYIKLCIALQGNTTIQHFDASNRFGRNDKEIAALTAAVRSMKFNRLTISRDFMSEGNISMILDALKEHSTLRHLDLSHSSVRDSNAMIVRDLLKTLPLKSLNLWNSSIGEEGMVAIAQGIGESRTINEVITKVNPGTDNIGPAYDAALDALMKNDSLSTWEFRLVPRSGMASSSNRDKQAEAAFAEKELLTASRCSPNLLRFLVYTQTSVIEDQTLQNDEAAEKWLEKLDGSAIEKLPFAERMAIVRRAPILSHFHERGSEPLLKLENYLEALPKLEGEATFENLTRKNEVGMMPVDNPQLWREHSGLLDQLLESGELKGRKKLLEKFPGSRTCLLDYAVGMDGYEKVAKTLEKHGIPIRADMLLDGTSASPALKMIIDQNKVPLLMTPENWQNQPRHEFSGVLREIPPEARARIPNLHSLAAGVGKSTNTITR